MTSTQKINQEGINKTELDQLDKKERYTLFGLTVPYLALVFGLIIIPIGWLFYMSFIGRDFKCHWRIIKEFGIVKLTCEFLKPLFRLVF